MRHHCHQHARQLNVLGEDGFACWFFRHCLARRVVCRSGRKSRVFSVVSVGDESRRAACASSPKWAGLCAAICWTDDAVATAISLAGTCQRLAAACTSIKRPAAPALRICSQDWPSPCCRRSLRRAPEQVVERLASAGAPRCAPCSSRHPALPPASSPARCGTLAHFQMFGNNGHAAISAPMRRKAFGSEIDLADHLAVAGLARPGRRGAGRQRKC